MTKSTRSVISGLLFLSPNIAGFLAFTLFPIIFSLYMAFTDWDLTLHNMFKQSLPRWIWFNNFIEVAKSPDFRKYF
ncbi:MAG: sugar ABC transporter permease, partial [Spirochaetia bacterium]|nr:sugar ABC transporter permease [Spirochaetia bacterium]